LHLLRNSIGSAVGGQQCCSAVQAAERGEEPQLQQAGSRHAEAQEVLISCACSGRYPTAMVVLQAGRCRGAKAGGMLRVLMCHSSGRRSSAFRMLRARRAGSGACDALGAAGKIWVEQQLAMLTWRLRNRLGCLAEL
jgi:hypothetical protein